MRLDRGNSRLPGLLAVLATIAWSSAQAGPDGTATDKDFVLPPVPEAAPFGSHAGPGALVTAIEFTGNSAIPTPELDAIAAPFLGRPLRVVDIEELRQRVSRRYVERGYVNSGAVIPADAYRDGVLRVQLIEGRISEVRLRGMAGLDDAYVITRLGNGGALNVNVLQERIRLLLADPLFERINARLAPGRDLGDAVAEIDVTRAPAFHAQVFANNYLAPSLGSGLLGVNGVLRNATGWGDALDATAQSNGHADHYDVGWTAPLFAGRTTLELRATSGASVVLEQPFDQLNIRSKVDSRQVMVSHPLVAGSRRQFSLAAGFSQRRSRTTLDGEPFSFTPGEVDGKTTVRDWSFSQDYVERFDRHVLAVRSTFVWGRNTLAGSSLPGEPPRRYRIWVGQAQTQSTLADTGTQLVLRGNLQRTADRLVPLERLGIGGRYTVRGYRENQLVRDQGYVVNAEIVHPLRRDNGDGSQLAIVPFLDLGRGANRDEPAECLAAVGIGLQGRWHGFEAELFMAKRLKTPSPDSHGNLQDHGIHLQVRYALL